MEFRTIRTDERDAVLDLLAHWLGDREFFARYFHHDPAFRDFMRQVTTNLFPPQNRQEQDHNCVPPGDC